MLAILVPLLLVAQPSEGQAQVEELLERAATPSADDPAALEKQFVVIFRPYADEGNNTAAWDRPIFSAEVTELIAEWKSVMPTGEVDAMNDGDWLCQCQDWDPAGFTATITSKKEVAPDVAELEVSVDLGIGGADSVRAQRMIFRREDGVWKVDDIVAEFVPQGIKQELRETIAEDKALIGERG